MGDAYQRTKFIIAALALLLLVSGCTSRTSFGPCVGAFDDRDPHLIYKVSGWNLALGIIFFETIFVPIIVLVDETMCPIGMTGAESERTLKLMDEGNV